jgi:hypothetical protein
VATRIYLASATPTAYSFAGLRAPEAGGADQIWGKADVGPARGVGNVGKTAVTVAGPTAGIEIRQNTSPGNKERYITPPLDRDVTISGTVTFNLWGSVTADANCGFRVRIDSQADAPSTTWLVNSDSGLELTTTPAAQNWSGGVVNSISYQKGDRLDVVVLIDDEGGSMVSGQTATLDRGAASAGVQGDSWIEFSETFGFQDVDAVPSGDVRYLSNTNTGLGIFGGTTHLLTTGRDGAVQDVHAFGADSWFTEWLLHDWITEQATYDIPLQGIIRLDLRAYYTRSFSSDRAFFSVQCFVCDADGSNAVLWGRGNNGVTMALNAEAAYPRIAIAGPDTTIATGQRLFFRFQLAPDDIDPNASTSDNHLVYGGGTPGGSGDSKITFPFSFTEPVANEAKLRRGTTPLRWR